MPAKNIKGITIDIGGTTTKLQQALKEPQKNAKDLSGRLKDINTALKFDPKNTELLAQKQLVLKDNIEGCKVQLDLLKQAQQEFIDGGKDLNSSEYYALEAEIGKVQGKMEWLQSQQDTIGSKFESWGQKISQVGTGMQNLGKKLTPVSAVAAGALTGSVASWKEVKEAQDNVAKATGKTGEDAEELYAIMRELPKEMAISFDDAATAVGQINTLFDGVSGEGLKALSEDFLKFADVNNVDVLTSINGVYEAMAAFGIPMEQAGDFLNKLTVASEDSGVAMNDLLTELGKNQNSFKGLGLSVEDSIALLATLNKSGAESTDVMKAMRQAFQNFTADGKNGAEEFKNLLENIKNGSASLDEINEVFGDRSAAQITSYIQSGALDYSAFVDSITSDNTRLNDVYEETWDSFDEMTTATNSLKDAGAELGESLMEVLAPAIQILADNVKAFSGWFSGLDENTQHVIASIGLFTALAAPVLLIGGKIVESVGIIGGALGRGIGKLGEFKTAISGAEGLGSLAGGGGKLLMFGGIALACVAVGAAIWDLWQNNEDFRNKITEIWNDIQKTFENFSKEFGKVWDDLCKGVGEIWQSLTKSLAPLFEGAFKLIGDILKGVLDVILGLFKTFTGLLTGDWDGFIEGIGNTLGGLWETINGIVTDTIPAIVETICNLFNGLKDWFSEFFGGMGQWFSDVWNDIANAITLALQGAWDWIQTTFGNIGQWFQDRFNDVMNSLQNIGKTVGDWWDSLWNGKAEVEVTGMGGVGWNAAGMKKPLIYDNATIFGQSSNGQLLGAGEAGQEAVLGTDLLNSYIDQAAMKALEYYRSLQLMQPVQKDVSPYLIAQAIKEVLIPELKKVQLTNNVYIDPNEIAKATFEPIDRLQYKKATRR